MVDEDVEDPRERADRLGKRTRAAVERNGAIFGPLADAMAEAVRRGGRLLLVGEGRLHLLAQFAASDIVGRRHQRRVQLPADSLDLSSGDPAAVARRVGPFDALLAVAGSCDDPLFNGTLEAARARGARIICVCVGRARLEGRADLAVDIPETRPHHIPGLAAMVLHYLAKLALARLAANPLVRPQRLDDGPRRIGAPERSDAGRMSSRREPEREERAGEAHDDAGNGAHDRARSPTNQSGCLPAMAPPADVLPLLEAEDEPTITLEIPEDALEIDFFDGVAEAARRVREGEEAGAGAAVAPAPAPEAAAARARRDEHEYENGPARHVDPASRPIRYRCKQCGQILVATAADAGRRSQCPKCGRRVKVPRAAALLAKAAAPAPVAPAPAPPPGPAPLSPVENEPEIDIAAIVRGEPLPESRSVTSSSSRAAALEPRSVSLRVRLDDCALSIRRASGDEVPARVAEIVPEGVEASLTPEEGARLAKGEEVEILLEAPAFIEPLVARAIVERVVPDEPAPFGSGTSARVLLPVDEGAPREVKDKLARLAGLVEKPQAAGRDAV